MLRWTKALRERRPVARLSQTSKTFGFAIFTESTASAHRSNALAVKATGVLVRKVSARYKDFGNTLAF
jgi:hypothetical protein